MRRRLALMAVLVLSLTACGGDDAGHLDGRAARHLDEQVDLIEFAINARQYDAARRGLRAVEQDVDRLARRGDVGELRLPAILASVDALDRALAEAATG